MSKDKPILIEISDPEESPAEAPAVPELGESSALQSTARYMAKPTSRLAKWFWGSLLAFLGFGLSIAAWNFVTGLIEQNVVLGYVAAGLLGIFLIVLLIVALKEIAGFVRLGRIDSLQKEAAHAYAAADLKPAQDVVSRLERLYANRPETEWGQARLNDRKDEQLDADALLAFAENEILAPLDDMARLEIEATARQVATVTAFVPIALADVFAALSLNLRMIRRIAEIYGGRAGFLGSWRLTKVVMAHLVATGAVAVGDDMIGSIAGGGVMSKISRRFGEGVINGALTARVGVAAMETCRPLPFVAKKRPGVTKLVQRALTGLFS
ncbi:MULTISPECIES: YcjF family protein [Halocynthiibacter]|uniref:YcjF family protein n=1 Tax=Halocynthiibacter halioticoli TaxID=2986804 RepID=A0AAE3LS35_9RHOB|nr:MULTISPECIES: YcjF family protein [Halocynthiibacter]MCV6825313.1 YcjF family protein [Halocynthiibacter halioticoli]MCW4058314.1 YcjF family protein [Halocynthiibacter sp. SDUM655004]